MRQVTAKRRKQTVASVKTFGSLRWFDNETYSTTWPHARHINREVIDCSDLIEQGSCPNQYRKTVQTADILANDNDSTRKPSTILETLESVKSLRISNVGSFYSYIQEFIVHFGDLSITIVIQSLIIVTPMGKAVPTVGTPIQ